MNHLPKYFLALALLCPMEGCALLPHKKTSPASQPPTPASVRPLHFPHISLSLPFFRHKPKPPRAQPLQRVGVISTVSADGTFVIIKLEPCLLVPPGRNLLVTAGAGDPIRLKAAESHPPYFIADIESGHPIAGQTVFQ